MKFSFYRNLTWLIGILVALEIFLKIGVDRGLAFMIADLIIVLILTFLFHRLRASGVNSGAFDPTSVSNVINTKSELEWQKKHDRWWQTHRQMTMVKPASVDMTGPSRSQQATSKANDVANSSSKASSPVNIPELERSNRELHDQIKNLNLKISTMYDSQGQSQDTLKSSKWYHQVMQMKRQIAKLKSEYK